MKSAIIVAHEASADKYDNISERVGFHAHEVLFGLAYEYVKPGEAILDIGIGTGLSSFLFHKAGLKDHGIDGSGRMLDICRGKGFAQELKLYDLSSGDWPYGAGRFDHAICCGVFHFFENLGVFFSESSRILKNNGTFGFTVIETPDDEAPHKDEGSGISIYSHNQSDIQELIERYGFITLKKVSFFIFKDTDKKDKILFTGYLLKKSWRST